MIGAKSGAAWRYLPASLSPAGSDSVRSGTASPGCSASENSRQNSEIRSQHSRYLFSLACFDPISFLEGEDEPRTPNSEPIPPVQSSEGRARGRRTIPRPRISGFRCRLFSLHRSDSFLEEENEHGTPNPEFRTPNSTQKFPVFCASFLSKS